MGEFKILAEKSSGFYKEKGSKFWAYAIPVQSVDEIEASLKLIKKLHPASRHHCFAYMIGSGDSSEIRANDDGEPNGSAGLPILNQIKSAGITNTLIVIARDFGGTKLGVSGLIRAYKTAAQISLKHAPIVEKKEQAKMYLKFDFKEHSKVMSILDKNNVSIQNSIYENCIGFEIIINKTDISYYKNLFAALDLTIKITTV